MMASTIQDSQNNQNKIDSVIIVIPSLNPDQKLIELMQRIRSSISASIPVVIVNDGSDPETRSFFIEAASDDYCQVLTHEENGGKGKALKTAFDYILNQYPDSTGVITVDGDGQHTTEDVKRCIEYFLSNPETVILGSRHFSKSATPLRSRFGNLFTRKLISNLNGLKLTDTQTGLRVLPYSTLKDLLNIEGERYEYEMNMLFYFREHNIDIEEIPIETIYIEENKSSHFNPLIDSLKIYSVFIKYSLSALVSFLIDIALFTLLVSLLRSVLPVSYIIVSTVVARVSSASFNYLSNRYLVFKAKKRNTSVYKYSLLFGIEMFLSGAIVQGLILYTALETEWMVKIFVDIIIFCLGFFVQKNWVFKKEHQKESKQVKD